MLSIRLVRVGKKHSPAFRIVVQEKHRAPSSKYVEKVGHYIPHQNPKVLELNTERIQYWISKGAQPTDTVHNMLISQDIIKDKKRSITNISKKRSGKLSAKADAAKEKAAAKAEAEAAKAADEAEVPAEDAPAEPEAEKPAEEAASAAEEKKEEKKEEAPAAEEKPAGEKKEDAPVEEKKEEEKAAE